MIISKLKSCCNDCPDIRGAFDTEVMKNCLGQARADSRIYCENMNICKKYDDCKNPIGEEQCLIRAISNK